MEADAFLVDRERRRLGSVTVYCGPSHAGKTKKLEAELDRARRQGRRVQHFSELESGSRLLVELDPATELVAMDEELARQGRHVIVAGLDLDFAGRPFGPMPALMSYSDRLTKLQASCQF